MDKELASMRGIYSQLQKNCIMGLLDGDICGFQRSVSFLFKGNIEETFVAKIHFLCLLS